MGRRTELIHKYRPARQFFGSKFPAPGRMGHYYERGVSTRTAWSSSMKLSLPVGTTSSPEEAAREWRATLPGEFRRSSAWRGGLLFALKRRSLSGVILRRVFPAHVCPSLRVPDGPAADHRRPVRHRPRRRPQQPDAHRLAQPPARPACHAARLAPVHLVDARPQHPAPRRDEPQGPAPRFPAVDQGRSSTASPPGGGCWSASTARPWAAGPCYFLDFYLGYLLFPRPSRRSPFRRMFQLDRLLVLGFLALQITAAFYLCRFTPDPVMAADPLRTAGRLPALVDLDLVHGLRVLHPAHAPAPGLVRRPGGVVVLPRPAQEHDARRLPLADRAAAATTSWTTPPTTSTRPSRSTTCRRASGCWRSAAGEHAVVIRWTPRGILRNPAGPASSTTSRATAGRTSRAMPRPRWGCRSCLSEREARNGIRRRYGRANRD